MTSCPTFTWSEMESSTSTTFVGKFAVSPWIPHARVTVSFPHQVSLLTYYNALLNQTQTSINHAECASPRTRAPTLS